MSKRLFPLFLTALAVVALSRPLSAQISEGGTPPSFEKAGFTADVPTVRMKPVDVPALLAEDQATPKDEPLRFGNPFEVLYDMTNSGIWDTLADGSRVWRLRIESPGAYSINLVYRAFWMPPGARFFVYNEDRSYVIGAFTERNNKDYGGFATAPVPGDASIVEYHEPAGTIEPGIVSIRRVIHAYRDLFAMGADKDADGFGSSGSCNNNVNCPEGAEWVDQKRAVAMVLTSGGFRLCSGALVNNVRQDRTPYFLTADHCLGGESSWIFMFNYESPGCTNVDGPTWMTVQGSTLRANFWYSDFALLELTEQPPDSYEVYYAGWSATDVAAQSSVGIHHPSGDIKKISFDYDPAISANYGGSSGGSHWRVGQWEDGTTEPGSSGSPLFDSLTKRITGQLHGGTASCASITSDYYGKIAKSWDYGSTPATRLQDWLDPDNTGALELDGFDPTGVAFAALPQYGDAPLEVQFEGSSALTVDSWTWDFGDGDSSFTQNPTHTYGTAGVYDVSLQVIAGPDTVERARSDYVIALADTMSAADTSVGNLGRLDIVINVTNTVPLKEIVIPVEYTGDVDMRLDSFSTAGCLTSDFVTQEFIHIYPAGKQATIRLRNDLSINPVPDVPPGTGPIVNLHFTLLSGAPDDSTVVDLSGYSTRTPLFLSTLVTYEPKINSPTVAYAQCCIGERGDIDASGILNVSDVTRLVEYLFKGGAPPSCTEEADVDASGVVTVSDVTYLVDFLFRGGQAPQPCP